MKKKKAIRIKRKTGKEVVRQKIKCLTSVDLKIIALCSMTIDHIGAVLLPQYLFLRVIGRIAFPIYCFLIVNGFFYTKDCKRYVGRLLLFACISEVFFDLAFFGTVYEPRYQNVFFSLAIGLVMICLLQRLGEKLRFQLDSLLRVFLGGIIIIVCCLLAYLLKTDYSFYGVLMILGFYVFRNDTIISFAVQAYMNLQISMIQGGAVLALPIIYMYNGKPGTKRFKWLFYIYYPAHLFVLFILKRYMGD